MLIPESKYYSQNKMFSICQPPASVSDRRQKIGIKLQWHFRTTQLLRLTKMVQFEVLGKQKPFRVCVFGTRWVDHLVEACVYFAKPSI